jgi:hypothetical protein
MAIFIENEVYFELQMGFHPVAVSLRQYNTQIHKSHTQCTYHIHTNTHITLNNIRKSNETRQRKANQLTKLTNNEGHITANEYIVEIEK